ncbi:hypothetical protein [Halotia branconii]|uniref:Uncharacterized protein n=1 Tax=Halotia branconii CENA392 TaxID=1539056 RepID=A0AAJ6P8I6_9CYAN|nr:hypothetical protein [Halotia branconii]WGV24824.1 hypothetical protein QI031_24135 [Halotia branconii CENA392]
MPYKIQRLEAIACPILRDEPVTIATSFTKAAIDLCPFVFRDIRSQKLYVF